MHACVSKRQTGPGAPGKGMGGVARCTQGGRLDVVDLSVTQRACACRHVSPRLRCPAHREQHKLRRLIDGKAPRGRCVGLNYAQQESRVGLYSWQHKAAPPTRQQRQQPHQQQWARPHPERTRRQLLPLAAPPAGAVPWQEQTAWPPLTDDTEWEDRGHSSRRLAGC